MGRWEPDAVGRLQQAALELYGERGFESTAVADIAERAGLTERTFFRHFADKREVLFFGSDSLRDLFSDGVANAPASLTPIDAVGAGLAAVAGFFEDRREHAQRRQGVIAANPSLQERELIKLASLAGAVAAALRSRGVGDLAALLAAEAGIAVFKIAFDTWIGGSSDRTFAAVMLETLGELRSVTSG
ncbi:MAG: TetR family transcriptional regulator [Mycobacterium sp.]